MAVAAIKWGAFLMACVTQIVPANALIRTRRPPAFPAKDDWTTWLGENGGSADQAKSCLKTVEGVNWTMSKKERAASKARRAKPVISDPGGLF